MASGQNTINVTFAADVDMKGELKEIMEMRASNSDNIRKIMDVINNADKLITDLESYTRNNLTLSDADVEGVSDSKGISAKGKKVLEYGTQFAGKASDDIAKTLKNTYGIIQDVYQRLVQASPLLTSIESLFNLAVQLFFMPLGTKLATEMLPAIIELVDAVMEIWEGFDGKSLGELMEDTIEIGAKVFGSYFENLGSKLGEQGGVLGSIGKVLTGLGDFIKNHGVKLITLITGLVSFIMENLSWLVGFMVGLKAMQWTLGLAQIAASLGAGGGLIGTVIGVGSVASVLGGAAAGSMFAAEGGYFPAQEGGTQVTLAERGEGEWVVPESKKIEFSEAIMNTYKPTPNVEPAGASFASQAPITIICNVNGYTDTDLSEKIVDTITNETNLARLRSGV